MAGINPQALASQLAKAATQQVGAEAKSAGAKEAGPVAGWVVPKLGEFNLDEALGTAYGKAAGYLNFMLSSEGLVLDVQQGDGQTTAKVMERGGARQYRTYAGEDMLKLYANQHGGRGVVADGQV
ncbi:MAG: hypothetical protein WAZ18_02955 [Alphaproteobacteria bacterium]